MYGARAVRDALLAASLNAPLSVGIIWTPMLAEDSLAAARKMAAEISDCRARHFYDAQHRAGKAVAKMLGAAGKIAWDIYLFYAKRDVWQSELPPPTAWAHQLTDSQWADADHWRTGALLHQTIANSIQALTSIARDNQPASLAK